VLRRRHHAQKKLLESESRQKRMKSVGSVQIPRAFLAHPQVGDK
jgi:hypothetical protein